MEKQRGPVPFSFWLNSQNDIHLENVGGSIKMSEKRSDLLAEAFDLMNRLSEEQLMEIMKSLKSESVHFEPCKH